MNADNLRPGLSDERGKLGRSPSRSPRGACGADDAFSSSLLSTEELVRRWYLVKARRHVGSLTLQLEADRLSIDVSSLGPPSPRFARALTSFAHP